jgi:hypothetical protein
MFAITEVVTRRTGADAMASSKDTVLDQAREQAQELADDAMERTRATVRHRAGSRGYGRSRCDRARAGTAGA